MNYKFYFFILVLLCLASLVSSCFFPEKFVVTININNNGEYSIEYDGILTYIPAKAAALQGQLTTEDEREMRDGAQEVFDHPDFKKSKYIGNGQFMVLYENKGVLNSSISLFGESLEIISITPFNDKTVVIKGIQLSKDDYEQLQMLNMKIDGTVKITTDAEVLNHNAKSKPGFLGFFNSYNWQIKSINDPAPYMLLKLNRDAEAYINRGNAYSADKGEYDRAIADYNKGNPVVPDGELSELRHGTYPSPPLGDFTHVGVDIVAPCGSDIYAFADGKVKDIIDNKNDKNFDTLGFMVIIEHPGSLFGKPFYTLYLHMQRPPEVKIGDQVYGDSTIIGNVGDTGKAFGCHTHFEIRYFPERFSIWGNIYGPGNQRNSEYFKQNWEDPIDFFKKYDGAPFFEDNISKSPIAGAESFNIKKHEYAPYYKHIKDKIRLYWLLQYGTDASINQVTNDYKPVIVTFKALPSGKIIDVKIVDSAGNGVLASKIQSSIQNTPLDKFPEYIDEKYINVKFSYYFF